MPQGFLTGLFENFKVRVIDDKIVENDIFGREREISKTLFFRVSLWHTQKGSINLYDLHMPKMTIFGGHDQFHSNFIFDDLHGLTAE